MLKEKYPQVHVCGFDIRPALWGTPIDSFVLGDLGSYESVSKAIDNSVDTVFHVAALVTGPEALLYRVNVTGVENVLKACTKAGVKRVIYTSSASVVFDGVDIVDGNEDLPYQSKNLDIYNKTKAIAEKLILSANSQNLKTISLRPHSIYGPGDPEAWPRMLDTAKKGSLKWKFASDLYKSSYTYIDNICHAEILAAEKLIENKPVGGKAYNINDGVDGMLWGKVYDVSELSGRPRSSFGTIPLPFTILYYISYLFWKVGLPLGNFTPYVLKLVTTTHTYSIERAQNELSYEPVLDHKTAWKKSLSSFSDWKDKQKKQSRPWLSYWLMFVSSLSIFGALQAFYSVDTLQTRQFSLKPEQITPLCAKLFGAWTLVATVVRGVCAFNLNNAVIYRVTYFTFLVALGLYSWEFFVSKSIPLFGASMPGFVASTSLIWMTFFPPK
uniref:3-beta hydroxysteroid dehydrogenase/isomerase domain-containing protein n=1 Tax=Arcella intermedia TaxID=1963864 RepID=A0A6B2L3P5_9EUKA